MTQPRRTLWFIIALAISIRLALAIIHPFQFPDSADYDILARNILHGDAYVTAPPHGLFATRMPGYPLFVAALEFLLGPSIQHVLIIQSLLSGLIVWLVYAIARRAGESVALLAALLAAFDPLTIGFSAAFLSEMPFTLLMLLALWLFVRLLEGGGFDHWLLAGLTWSAAVYMRASALWCILPLALWTLLHIKRRTWRHVRIAAIGVVVSTAIVLVSLLPWQTRNFAIFHSHFFRLTTLEGISLYEAVYPDADGSPKQDIIQLPPDMSPMNEAQRNDEWNRRAWQYIRNDPGRIVLLALRKFARTWSPWLNASEFRNSRLQFAIAAWYIPLFLLGLLGLVLAPFPRGIKGLLLIPILYFSAVHSLFLGSVRYRAPLMPIVCIFAAAGIMTLLQRRKARQQDANVAHR
ncbi:MAG TPA: glycosyltransferase family 39 protein [Phycisphaerae bacterium]|nr:glycosyltransferase family 39 protein [Phycisphaerae bacterium]